MFRELVLCFCAGLVCHARMPSTYSDYYARNKLWPLSEQFVYLADNSSINGWLSNCFYNYTFYKHVDQPCDLFTKNNLNITCAGSVMVSHDDQAIILIFRGTTSSPELTEEEKFYNMTQKFPGGGTVSQFYYNGFLIIWNAGLRDALLSAKNAFPSYELWITGWSMGGSLTGIAAPYISQMGFFNKNNLRMVSFGELRIGHKDFADRFADLVPWSYRVVHRNDTVPHLIPLDGGYVHHAPEIWYNNNMTAGDPYIQCNTQESLNCSDSVPSSSWTWNDHPCFGATFNTRTPCVKFTNPPQN